MLAYRITVTILALTFTKPQYHVILLPHFMHLFMVMLGINKYPQFICIPLLLLLSVAKKYKQTGKGDMNRVSRL